ncbi:MAG: hypothetical protein QNJ72_44100 [Pleurocapsa sp. MO_226.B13]|nr:hypothetical protein [Pleurocapsa sp. MO_226.B13]
MKLNLPKLLLTAGLGLGTISAASVAEAGIRLNGKSLTGQTSEKQLQQQLQKHPEVIDVLTENESSDLLLEIDQGYSDRSTIPFFFLN